MEHLAPKQPDISPELKAEWMLDLSGGQKDNYQMNANIAVCLLDDALYRDIQLGPYIY